MIANLEEILQRRLSLLAGHLEGGPKCLGLPRENRSSEYVLDRVKRLSPLSLFPFSGASELDRFLSSVAGCDELLSLY